MRAGPRGGTLPPSTPHHQRRRRPNGIRQRSGVRVVRTARADAARPRTPPRRGGCRRAEHALVPRCAPSAARSFFCRSTCGIVRALRGAQVGCADRSRRAFPHAGAALPFHRAEILSPRALRVAAPLHALIGDTSPLRQKNERGKPMTTTPTTPAPSTSTYGDTPRRCAPPRKPSTLPPSPARSATGTPPSGRYSPRPPATPGPPPPASSSSAKPKARSPDSVRSTASPTPDTGCCANGRTNPTR